MVDEDTSGLIEDLRVLVAANPPVVENSIDVSGAETIDEAQFQLSKYFSAEDALPAVNLLFGEACVGVVTRESLRRSGGTAAETPPQYQVGTWGRTELAATGTLAAAATVTPLVWHSGLLTLLLELLPLAVAVLAYLGAIKAAIAHGTAVQVAFDLHGFDPLRALRLAIPVEQDAEQGANIALYDFLRQGVPRPVRVRRSRTALRDAPSSGEVETMNAGSAPADSPAERLTDGPVVLPYCHVVGQHTLRRALEIAYVAPTAGGILATGQRGTADSNGFAMGVERALGSNHIIILY